MPEKSKKGSAEKSSILVAGNWKDGIEEAKGILKPENYRLEVHSSTDIRSALNGHDFGLVILALEGKSIEEQKPRIAEIKATDDERPLIVVSDNKNWEPAVGLLKTGVNDYLASPLSKEKLRRSAAHHLKLFDLTRRVFLLDKRDPLSSPFEGMVGKSGQMQENFRMIEAVAKSNATVLLTGESGTGKELVAKAVHRRSDRSSNRFVDLNCGAIPRDLLENELFGHEKGAFTGAHRRYNGSFEAAHRGTLFLDEISEMDPLLQVKLLRVLQERSFMRIGGNEKIEVDVRIIAATNRNLHDEIQKGRFREDLFYRLNVVNISIPSLRERREDIPFLARHFLEYYSARNNRIFLDFAVDAMEALINYEWPGNVRELENTIERVVVLHNASQVKLKFLPKQIQRVNRTIAYSEAVGGISDEGRVVPLEALERQAIQIALMQYRGNVALAAKKLRIGQATLYRKVKKYQLEEA
ncbi:MAG: sigma-54-dependent Fis family transcriptional regulator [Deltaproteobacteria bacterium]|nr:sigma-54-dependent Fis family transcriptional regulator [Deltaproteobacteria bacterium]